MIPELTQADRVKLIELSAAGYTHEQCERYAQNLLDARAYRGRERTTPNRKTRRAAINQGQQ